MDNEKNLRKTIERYPHLTLQDIFKFEYQSILGPGHLIKDEESALEYLKQEVETIVYRDDLLNEPLTEELGNGTIRINLRPYLHKKYPIEDLAKIFYASQEYYKVPKENLIKELEENKENIKRLYSNYQESAYEEYIKLLKDNDFRPFSHSLIYRSNYYPAYRVVNKDLFTQFLDTYKKEKE